MSFVPLAVLHLATSPSPISSEPTSPLPGENDSSWIGPGLLGFLSLVFLAVALYFIYRGLTKQLRRVTFDEDAVNAEEVAAQQPEGASPAAAPVAPGAGDPRPEDQATPPGR